LNTRFKHYILWKRRDPITCRHSGVSQNVGIRDVYLKCTLAVIISTRKSTNLKLDFSIGNKVKVWYLLRQGMVKLQH